MATSEHGIMQSRGLEALFAANGRTAIVLRRGPRTQNHLIRWDLETDAFARGQWMRGRVRLEDLSANGERLLYWAAQYHRTVPPKVFDGLRALGPRLRAQKRMRRGRKLARYMRADMLPAQVAARAAEPLATWTAISRTPYFTALALWPSLGAWTGGGGFDADGAIVLREFEANLAPIANCGPPDVPVRAAPLRGPAPKSARRASLADEPATQAFAEALRRGGAQLIHWIDVDDRFGTSFACDRRIYRLPRGAAPADPLAQATLIADLADLTFELVAPDPKALQW